jgi:hypothetical protein
MRRYRSVSASLAGFAVLLSVAAARAETSVAVLGIEPVEVPDAQAVQLTDALRQRAAATPGMRLVPGKDLVEMKMIFGCDGETPACMAQAGKSLGADKLVYGTLKKGPSAGALAVSLKQLDVRSGAVEHAVNESAAPAELTSSAPRWFAALVGVELKPTLTVTSEPPGADVAIDGKPAGKTPLTLTTLSPGKHQVDVTALGRVPFTRTLELRPGGAHELVATMESAPPPVQITTSTEAKPASHPGRTAKAVGIAAVAAAVVAGGVAIYTWRTYRDLEDTAHADLLNARPSNPTPEQARFFNSPSCSLPAAVGSSPQLDKYKTDCSRGESFANATTALWVVAGVLATGGVVSLIVGDRQAKNAAREKSTGNTLRQTLRIAPVFNTRSGGLQAAFEF